MRRLLLFLFLAVLPAHAVIVRGKVTSPLGVPLPGARVQLIQGKRSVGGALAGLDGSYQLESTLTGRFLLLTSPSPLTAGFAPQVGNPFYAGASDVLTIDIALDPTAITPQLSGGTPTTRLARAPAQVPADELLTSATLLPELRHLPSTLLLQQGATGSPAFLYLEGAPPATLLVRLNGVAANPLGQAFDLATAGTTGLAATTAQPAVELAAGAEPLAPVDASGGLLSLHADAAESLHPTLTYTGDAGSRGALQNEAVATYAHNRYDVLAGFSRFDLANATPSAPFHLVTWSGNVGYHISAGTSLRVTLRDDLSAAGLASPFLFFGVTPAGRDAHQNVLGSALFDTRTLRGWRNQLRYGNARLRQQTFDYETPPTGLPVTFTGANGTSARGTATFLPRPAREDQVTGRDEAAYDTYFPWKPWLRVTGRAQVEEDRGADLLPAQKVTLARTQAALAAGLTGAIRNRLFYEASGEFDHVSLYGHSANPRLGLTYAPVREGTRRFRGTTLHATAATGTRETSLFEQQATPASFVQPRSRTFDAAVDQVILARKLRLHATYFHSQFSHEFEALGVAPETAHALLSQTLALRTQGVETGLRFTPYPRLLLEGSYTYLAALTELSAARPAVNPAVPGAAIGSLTALAGQRPFHRPPSTGTLVAEYSGEKLNLSFKGSFVSRSDDSTGLIENPPLLLPNRNLAPGYTALDANLSYVVTPAITIVSQFTNLTDDRHLAPFGYLSTPFVARAGLRIRLGRE